MPNRHILKSASRFALFVIVLLTAFIGTTINLTAKTATVQQTSKNSLWSIQTPSNTVYLLGSLHVLKADAYPLSAAIRKAYTDSQILVFETDIAAMQDLTVQAKMLELGVYPEGQNLLQNLDGGTRQLLEKKMNELGLPLPQFSRFKPWFLALTLTTLELQRMGFNLTYGIDIHFFNRAKADEKEIEFLEAVDFQIDLLGNMAAQDQNAFLGQTLKDLEMVNELAGDLVKFWKAGDSNRLHNLLAKSFKEYPELYDRLLIRRNKKWVKEVEAATRKNKNVLFVVGAGHLVGPESVIDLLSQRGFEVKQR